jgi:8-oxo-dGTP diphosphatase
VAGPVSKTPTHSNNTALGWENFSRLISGYSLPAYAIGGMRLGDLKQALNRGAQGLAMIRGAWGEE